MDPPLKVLLGYQLSISNISSKPASPLGFLISANDTNSLLVAQIKNLIPIFPSTQLIFKHTVNPCATFQLYHHLPSPTPTSLSSPDAPAPLAFLLFLSSLFSALHTNHLRSLSPSCLLLTLSST